MDQIPTAHVTITAGVRAAKLNNIEIVVGTAATVQPIEVEVDFGTTTAAAAAEAAVVPATTNKAKATITDSADRYDDGRGRCYSPTDRGYDSYRGAAFRSSHAAAVDSHHTDPRPSKPAATPVNQLSTVPREDATIAPHADDPFTITDEFDLPPDWDSLFLPLDHFTDEQNSILPPGIDGQHPIFPPSIDGQQNPILRPGIGGQESPFVLDADQDVYEQARLCLPPWEWLRQSQRGRLLTLEDDSLVVHSEPYGGVEVRPSTNQRPHMFPPPLIPSAPAPSTHLVLTFVATPPTPRDPYSDCDIHDCPVNNSPVFALWNYLHARYHVILARITYVLAKFEHIPKGCWVEHVNPNIGVQSKTKLRHGSDKHSHDPPVEYLPFDFLFRAMVAVEQSDFQAFKRLFHEDEIVYSLLCGQTKCFNPLHATFEDRNTQAERNYCPRFFTPWAGGTYRCSIRNYTKYRREEVSLQTCTVRKKSSPSSGVSSSFLAPSLLLLLTRLVHRLPAGHRASFPSLLVLFKIGSLLTTLSFFA